MNSKRYIMKNLNHYYEKINIANMCFNIEYSFKFPEKGEILK